MPSVPSPAARESQEYSWPTQPQRKGCGLQTRRCCQCLSCYWKPSEFGHTGWHMAPPGAVRRCRKTGRWLLQRDLLRSRIPASPGWAAPGLSVQLHIESLKPTIETTYVKHFYVSSDLPSRFMPILKHFLRRQYWHWFRWCWSIGQLLLPRHW
jgi:hypothetical protein